MSAVTEKEAEGRWCPLVRIAVGAKNSEWEGSTLTNRGDSLTEETDTNCIGSACMAWRWSDLPRKGYCGLVGKP